MRRAYPSDLTETRWRLIEEILQTAALRGRKRSTDLREVVNAIQYRWVTGCPWRMLPHDYPAWETVYTYFHRWQKTGQLRQIREILLRKSPYLPLEEPGRLSLPTAHQRKAGRQQSRSTLSAEHSM